MKACFSGHLVTFHSGRMISYIHFSLVVLILWLMSVTAQFTSIMQRTMTEMPVVRKLSSNKFVKAVKQP